MDQSETKRVNKDVVWKQLQTLFTVLSNGSAWFTGIPIKKYLKNNLFSYNNTFSNSIISSGRWNAYAHFSPLSAFQNLLDKHGIKSHKTVIVHPLLPKEFIDELEQRKCKILSLDIEKETLQWNSEKLESYLRLELSTQPINLVIFSSMNGFLNEITSHLQRFEKHSISSLIFIQSNEINDELMHCVSAQTSGSVLISGGESFIHNQLNEVMGNKPIAPQKWYFSWFLENRTEAILEYNLSNSQVAAEQLLNVYFYLLGNVCKKFSFGQKLYVIIAKVIVLKSSFKNIEEAKEVLRQCYYNMFTTALPDTFFQLQEIAILENTGNNFSLYSPNSTVLNKLQSFLFERVSQAQQGSLEIPAINFSRPYSALHFFTTNQVLWVKEIEQQGYKVGVIQSISLRFSDAEKFPNTAFIKNYGLFVQL